MRVALCISGYLRLCRLTLQSLETFVLGPFKPDVFISTWENGDEAPGQVRELASLYGPTALEIENWPATLASWGSLAQFEARKRNDSNVPNILGMYHKIFRANRLKALAEQQAGKPYDAVIRYRTDLMLYGKPEIDILFPNHVYLGNRFGYGGLPDLLAFGPSAPMDLYSDVFNRIPGYIQEGCLFHPECLLEWHARRCFPNGVLFSQIPFTLIRGSPVTNPVAWVVG